MQDCLLIIGKLNEKLNNEQLFDCVLQFVNNENYSKIIVKDQQLEKTTFAPNELPEIKTDIDKIQSITCTDVDLNEAVFVFQNGRHHAKISFKTQNAGIVSSLGSFMNELSYLFVNSYIDAASQNSKELEMWDYYGLKVPSYARLEPAFDYDNPDLKEINIESLPGHDHNIGCGDQLLFTVRQQMYFSGEYYKYIPKSLFDDFKDCEENIILDNGLRRITLYKNIADFQGPLNVERQFKFRKQIGIDTIAHELQDWQQVDMELPVIITKKNCEKGQTKVIRFLSKEKKLVLPSLAEMKEIKEYLEDGITVVFEKIESLEKRDK